jgi:hypothetical protein
MVRCLVAWGLRLQLMGCEMRVMRVLSTRKSVDGGKEEGRSRVGLFK